jgi:prepilin-type N-terminal cleavage/methylation domain-containing protein
LNERGFSLVEVIAAMVILTIGVLGLAASAAAVGRLTTEGARMSGAANASASKIEEMRSMSCTVLASGSDTAPGGYGRRWVVEAGSDKYIVTMTVSYTNGRQTRTTVYVAEVACV